MDSWALPESKKPIGRLSHISSFGGLNSQPLSFIIVGCPTLIFLFSPLLILLQPQFGDRLVELCFAWALAARSKSVRTTNIQTWVWYKFFFKLTTKQEHSCNHPPKKAKIINKILKRFIQFSPIHYFINYHYIRQSLIFQCQSRRVSQDNLLVFLLDPDQTGLYIFLKQNFCQTQLSIVLIPHCENPWAPVSWITSNLSISVTGSSRVSLKFIVIFTKLPSTAQSVPSGRSILWNGDKRKHRT